MLKEMVYALFIHQVKRCTYYKIKQKTYEAPNLKNIRDTNINKIFHYARADLLFMRKYLKTEIENIECTKIMSKLARNSDKHGLKDLVKEFIGFDINKNLQSSDFGGDLTEKQLQYCAKDVVYLHEIFDNLKKILLRENRYQLYKNSIKFVNSRVDLDLASFTSDIWSH